MAEGNVSYNWRFHIAEFFRSQLQITNVNLSQDCSEICRVSEKDVFPRRSADNVTRSYF